MAPINGGFDTFVIAELHRRKVPVVVTAERENADVELRSVSVTGQTGLAAWILGEGDTTEAVTFTLVEDLRPGAWETERG